MIVMDSNRFALVMIAALVISSLFSWMILADLVAKEKAWIYQHIENKTILYCDSDQGDPRDYDFLGTAKMPSNLVEGCSLAQ